MIGELKHHYGKNYHVLQDHFLSSLLALLCSKDTQQPLITDLIKHLYTALIARVIALEFPKKRTSIKTRMHHLHRQAVLRDELIDFDTRVISVNLARAGIVPSQLCYEFCNHIFKPKSVRQDHIYINRAVDVLGHVTGSLISGYKIGGSVNKAIVLFPDPMGATGGSISSCLKLYKEKIPGNALKWIALNLIITPEFLKNVKKEHPDLIVYGLRLDRGLSPRYIQKSVPGTYWEKERGLNDNQYIVPGAGGLGEILNNAFV